MASSTTDNLLEKILGSVFFKRALKKAPLLARNSDSLLKLLKAALQKTQEIGVGGVLDTLRQEVFLLGRLIRAYATGEYREISPANLLKIIAGLIYFISPIDLIPDILPVIGYTDDMLLLGWVLKGVSAEIEKFREWDRTHIKI